MKREHRIIARPAGPVDSLRLPDRAAKEIEADYEQEGWIVASVTPVFDRGNPDWGLLYYSVTQYREVAAEAGKLPDEFDGTIYCFNPTSGKWKYEGRGFVPEEVFSGAFSSHARRAAILRANGGKCPGLSGPGNHLTWVVILDDRIGYGWPLLLHALDHEYKP